jgi:hypothetical protein
MRPLVALLATLGLLLAAGSASAYPWPFKPFDKQHPIRGDFGDPRTVYENGILSDPFDGAGFFSFHQGVDIAAPNGTPIYAIADGTAHYLGAATLNLDTGNGVVFQFFHIISVVGEGQQVTMSKTILGYVQPPFGHVHISEIDGARVVNPLLKGHLSPYRDKTKPTIRDIVIKNQTGIVQAPLGLCGGVELDAEIFDTTPVPVPGSFHNMPVAPAFVEWKLTRLGGAVALPWTIVADFRNTLPPNTRFWNVYAKGTYENAPRFGREQYGGMPGRYLFSLSPGFDTTTVASGVYVLSVRAADIRGNSTLATRRLSVLNAKGSCPGSLPAATNAAPPSEPPASSPTP